MRLAFTKMQALGNDFVVFDGVRQKVALARELRRRIADRRLGIGCDQILVVERPEAEGADFRYRVYNADGTEVAQCGNGVRCLALFLCAQGLTDRRELVLQANSGLVRSRIEPDGQVRVEMGVPRFEPRAVPFVAESRQDRYDLAVDGTRVSVFVLSMGNPHAVQMVDDVEQAPVAAQGPRIESHPRFPERTNVEYMQVVDSARIRVRVYERGAGETPACGTGACAAAVAGRRLGMLDECVEVELPGGTLRVRWAGEGRPVYLSGPAQAVFEGTVDPQRL